MSPAVSERFFDYSVSFAEPVSVRCDPSTALLIVDMQYQGTAPDCGAVLIHERLRPGSMGYFIQRTEMHVIPTVKSLLAYFHSHGLPVVYLTFGSQFRNLRDLTPRLRDSVRRLEKVSGVHDLMWSGSSLFAIRSEIEPTTGDLVVMKTTLGAFNSTPLEEELRRRGIETLIIVGASTNACVETTARDAADRGFACVLVDEGTADYDREAHEASLLAFHVNFGRVLTTASDVIDALESSRKAQEVDLVQSRSPLDTRVETRPDASW